MNGIRAEELADVSKKKKEDRPMDKIKCEKIPWAKEKKAST